ncbi:MAG TPA: head GIN domain-containing protein [Pyrinomonadaceae bacterium]
MKRAIIFLSLMLFTLSGCKFFGHGHANGSGSMKQEKRTVPSFTALNISGAYDVEIVAQKEQSLEIEGDDNLLPLITTEVRNGVLEIDNKKSFNTKNKIRIRISVPAFNAINTSGASDIVIKGIRTDQFKIDSSGAGKIRVEGEAQTVEIETSGAGGVDTRALRAQKVNITSSGAASAEVYASEELTASVSGAGNVNYYGNPKVINENKSGAGSITRMDSTE